MKTINTLRVSRYLLYASIMLGAASVAKEASLLYLFILLSSLAVATYQDEKGIYLLSDRFITSAAILLILSTLYGINYETFFNKVLEILFILIGARLWAKKRQRDMLQLYLLTLLMVVGSAVCRWGMEFGLLLMAEAYLLVSGLLFLYSSREKEQLSRQEGKRLIAWGLALALALYPLTSLFFLILPRSTITLIPAWAGGRVARSGFGEKITPGGVEEIKRDPSIALRVRWLRGKRPLSEQLYWRGKVYPVYRKGSWYSIGDEKAKGPLKVQPGNDVEYQVVVEPYKGKALFSLGFPMEVKIKRSRITLLQGATLKVEHQLNRRVLYSVRSRMVEAFPRDGPLNLYTQVPSEVREKLSTLAMGIMRKGGSSLKLAGRVEEFLKSAYSYTLSPEILGREPVVTFLFTTKKGHCELFASSMALLLRVMGIPTRLVAGFLGGEWNEIGRYYIIKRSDAHTWIEVYKNGVGWVPFDPTPSALISSWSKGRWSLMGKILDTFRLQWYEWVVSYDFSKQKGLAEDLRAILKAPSLKPKGRFSKNWRNWIIPPLILLITLFSCWVVKRWGKKQRGLAERLLNTLKEKGYTKMPGDTLLELSASISLENPILGRMVEDFVRYYYLMEYGKREIEERVLWDYLKEIREFKQLR